MVREMLIVRRKVSQISVLGDLLGRRNAISSRSGIKKEFDLKREGK